MDPVMVLSTWAVLLSAAVAPQSQSEDRHWDQNAPCYRWPAVDMDQDGVFDRVDHCVSTPKGCIVDKYGCESDSDGDGVCDGLDQCPGTPQGMKVDAKGCGPGQAAFERKAAAPKEIERPAPPPPPPSPPVSEMERQLISSGKIRLENVYFETGSAKLLPESEETLREAGRTLEKFRDLNVEVQGHTDTRGSNRYNMRLSEERAQSVRHFLLEHSHLQAENLTAKGYGEAQPETKERNDEELLRNRRVVLRVLNPEALPKGVKVEN